MAKLTDAAKTKLVAKFKSLDKTLKPRIMKTSGKRRTVSGSKDDAISVAVDKCQSASELAALASHMGCPDEYIVNAAKNAPNFGQFGMRVRNKLRGIVKRVQECTDLGIKVKPADVFEVKDFKKLVRGSDSEVTYTKPKATKKKTVKKKTATEKAAPKKSVKKAVKKKVKKKVTRR